MDVQRPRRLGRTGTFALPVRSILDLGVLDPGLDDEPHTGRPDDPGGRGGFRFDGFRFVLRLERVRFHGNDGLRIHRFGFDGVGNERFRNELRLDGFGFDGVGFRHDGSDRFWSFRNDGFHGRQLERTHELDGLPQWRLEGLLDSEVQEPEAV